MYCQNRMVYTVREGDSLYRLARQYDTTVTELILGNPGVNPYNLQIGMRLNICPGEGYDGPDRPQGGMTPSVPPQGGMTPSTPPQGGMTPSEPTQGGMFPGGMFFGGMFPGGQRPQGGMRPGGMTPSEPSQSEQESRVENLMEDMRMAWLAMLYWNRMYLMSVAADGADQQAVEERAMETADEITDVFARVWPIHVVRQLRNLLTAHVELTGEVIRALKSGNMENYDNLIREWYANANEIAELIVAQNPFFGGREIRNMLLNYLDVMRESIEHQMNGQFGQSIDAFRDMKKQVLAMADYIARGLLAR